MTAGRLNLGRQGEEIALARLCEQGAVPVGRNFRTRHGELDLIVLDGDALVFVEVKTLRAGALSGPERPALAVGRRKQARIRRLAAAWLADRPPLRSFAEIRFDVVGIRMDAEGRVLEHEHLRGAF